MTSVNRRFLKNFKVWEIDLSEQKVTEGFSRISKYGESDLSEQNVFKHSSVRGSDLSEQKVTEAFQEFLSTWK